ncbi:DHH family phosphoesterase [Owenweeksia hongkongensis]|uniref:DHH family phosphoesterase n=1 Tax=Owenweeksia hongkongensis TaxID=253245 RepID=UPI003A9318C8
MKIDESIVQGAQSLLADAQNIVITNHVGPDGDAMGSALGLKEILRQQGKKVTVIVPNIYPKFLKWMKGDDEVIIFEGNHEVASEVLKITDLIIHLDYNSLSRSGDMRDVLASAAAKRLVIDHHQQPDDFATVLYSDTNMSSTCEMVFHLAQALGWDEYINKESADCLYTGIMTDTGNFRFSSTTPTTHRAVARLMEKGVLPQEIASSIYDTNSRNRLKLLSRCLERMEVFPQYQSAIMSLAASDLDEFDYQKGDTEGFVNYGLTMEGTIMSVFLSEKDNRIKMSFRSKGDFNVNQLARDHFNGGGHINAAGGISEESMEKTIEKLKALLPQYEELAKK